MPAEDPQVYEVERDRHTVMYSGPLEVGECVRVVPEERAGVLAEVLREIRSRIIAGTNARDPQTVLGHIGGLVERALEGVPQTHELVPLGTQQALVDLLDARAQAHSRHPDEVPDEWREAEHAAAARARALVEGVEPDRHSDVHRCQDCAVPTSRPIGSYWLASDELWAEVVGDDTIVLCPSCFHDRGEAKDIHVSWRAVVEGVERTHTPPDRVGVRSETVQALFDGLRAALNDPDGQKQAVADRLLTGERLLMNDLRAAEGWPQHEPPQPTPSGLTAEMVEAMARALFANPGPHSPTGSRSVGVFDHLHPNWQEKYRTTARQVLIAAAFELEAGSSEGHTLVPNEHLNELADACTIVSRQVTGDGRRRWSLLAAALRALEIGGRPQWPETGDTGQEGAPDA